ncbi:MAG: PilZ domain-containing protein, partial [Leptospiraceae bacterium]|nr:PilZ domain-containing protein [Leptospiraceae bacterium]
RSKKLLGALIVKNQKDLELGDYTLVNMLFSLIQRELNQTKKIYFSTAKYPILDISLGGVGFIVEDPKLFSFFQLGEEIMIEIFIREISAILSIVVRNTTLQEDNKLRVGGQFQNLTQEESLFLQNFYNL